MNLRLTGLLWCLRAVACGAHPKHHVALACHETYASINANIHSYCIYCYIHMSNTMLLWPGTIHGAWAQPEQHVHQDGY